MCSFTNKNRKVAELLLFKVILYSEGNGHVWLAKRKNIDCI